MWNSRSTVWLPPNLLSLAAPVQVQGVLALFLHDHGLAFTVLNSPDRVFSLLPRTELGLCPLFFSFRFRFCPEYCFSRFFYMLPFVMRSLFFDRTKEYRKHPFFSVNAESQPRFPFFFPPLGLFCRDPLDQGSFSHTRSPIPYITLSGPIFFFPLPF